MAAVCLLLLMCAPCAFSQNNYEDMYSSRFITITEGLPHSNVDGLFQDDRGFVWISFFGGGLARYDGSNFVHFSTSSTHKLASNYVTETCADDFDRMWVATTSGLELIDMKTMSVVEDMPEFARKTAGEYCNYIATDSLGCLWYNTRNVFYRIAFEDSGEVASVDSLVVSDGVLNTRLKFKDVDSDGSMWTTIDGAVHKVSYIPGQGLQAVPLFTLGPNFKAVDFLAKDNEVWIAANRGLFRYERYSGHIRHYTHKADDPKSIASNVSTGLVLTPEGQVALGTMAGLSIYSSLTDSFYNYSAETNRSGDKILSDDIVRSLLVVGGSLWVGTELEGISILQRKTLHMLDIHHRENSTNTIPDSPVSALIVDNTNALWLGSSKYGVIRISGDYNDYRTSTYNTRNSQLVSNSVSAFAMGEDGLLWIGTKTGGINTVNPAYPGSFRVLREAQSANDRIDNINNMIYDPVNRYMWILSRTGLFYYDYRSGEFHNYKQIMLQCISAEIDATGNMWVGTQDGLMSIDLHTLEYSRYSDFGACFSVDMDSAGNLWLGNFGLGVFKVNFASDGTYSYRLFTNEDGLCDNRVRGLLASDQYVYVATENGLSRISTEGNVVERFDRSDGLISMIFSNGATFESKRSGLKYFGHKSGVMVLLSDKLIPKPKSYIESDVKLITGIVGDSELNFAYESGISLHEGDLALTFEFSDFAFNDNTSGVEYYYRVYPLDEEWRRVRSANKYVRYDYPPSGSFKLQVRSCDMAGNVLSQDERDVTVKPYYYKTWWFMLALIFFITLTVMFIVNYRTRSIQRQRSALSREVKRQTRELAEKNEQLEAQARELEEHNRRLQKLNEELASQKLVFNSGTVTAQPSRDDKFVRKFMDKMKELYHDPDLDVDRICREMGMSRTLLSNMVSDAFGMSIAQFLRTYRLSIAREMLTTNKADSVNISEIAYDVGFNDPKYFTRCFTREFKQTPSSLLRQTDEGARESGDAAAAA